MFSFDNCIHLVFDEIHLSRVPKRSKNLKSNIMYVITTTNARTTELHKRWFLYPINVAGLAKKYRCNQRKIQISKDRLSTVAQNDFLNIKA